MDWNWPKSREERRVKIRDMKRGQVEALARQLGIANPENYNLPELRETVKCRYMQKKRREGK